ncbi:MAG: ATPase, T2SS/T4P/T4SS family [Thermohalobaculum sp.]|nr:ATPase, T2SS/T4P/T4SS family [Thermohalobaculum sp.]
MGADGLGGPQAEERLAVYLAARLDRTALERARRIAAGTGERLGDLAVKLGLISERDLAGALAELHGCPLVGPDDWPETPFFEDRLNPRFLGEARVLPLGPCEAGFALAMADPGDRFARDAIGLIAGMAIVPHIATAAEIERAIERLYGPAAPAEGVDEPGTNDAADIERLKDLASEAPVIRLVNRMIARAIDLRASDIHLEIFETRVRLRYRIDGVLTEAEAPPAHLAAAVVSRIKIVARLNIAERRLPQDGRIKIALRGTPVDLRIATLPTLHGESVVMRVLDQESVSLDFAALGIPAPVVERLTRVLERPNGIFLITGPTGSGKTTTLYAALTRLNAIADKIVTVEDPVEYQLDGVNQVQVHPAIGLDFAQTLRAILRNDPDIVLVGEIRDVETAEVAAQAALTGHLVLSTLHTNSAAGSVTRLMDMGLKEYLIAATLNGAAAQRLVRRLCPDCRAATPPDAVLNARLGVAADAAFWRAGGCTSCAGRGYRGRAAILEVLEVTDEIRRLIVRGADPGEIEASARAAGMRSLRDEALAAAVQGITSLDEVLRVTGGV